MTTADSSSNSDSFFETQKDEWIPAVPLPEEAGTSPRHEPTGETTPLMPGAMTEPPAGETGAPAPETTETGAPAPETTAPPPAEAPGGLMTGETSTPGTAATPKGLDAPGEKTMTPSPTASSPGPEGRCQKTGTSVAAAPPGLDAPGETMIGETSTPGAAAMTQPPANNNEAPSLAPDAQTSRQSIAEELHRRTYEVELLISLAVLFALFQIPPALEALLQRQSLELASSYFQPVFLLLYFLELIVNLLIAAFVLHLAGRAYWIGLIGLQSVFPQGIRWEKLKFGPVFARFYREQLPSMTTLIEQLDDLCSLIFSFAFSILIIFASALAIALLMVFPSRGLAHLLRVEEHWELLWMGLYMTFFVFGGIGSLLDKAYKQRLKELPDRHWLVVGIRQSARVLYTATTGPMFAIISMTLETNSRRRSTILILIFGTMFGLVGVYMTSSFLKHGLLRFQGLPYYYEEMDAYGVEPHHYDSLAPDDIVIRPQPSIQSDLVTDRYVRLFLPYLPRDNEALRELCPQVKPFYEEGFIKRYRRSDPRPNPETVEKVLECLSRLYEIELDGEPLENPTFLYSRHPRHGARGMVTYIPTAPLASGQHLLRIQKVDPFAENSDEEPDPASEPTSDSIPAEQPESATEQSTFIPFWK